MSEDSEENKENAGYRLGAGSERGAGGLRKPKGTQNGGDQILSQ